MDHIVPVSRGGARLSRANVRRLCGACNLSKGARLIGQGGVAIDGTGSAPRPPASLAMRTGSEIHAAAS